MRGRDLLHDEQGAALLMVLVFGVIASATAFVYLMGQMQATRHNLARPVALQARLNARSGVYWALERLARDSTAADTLKTIDANARATDPFNTSLFAGMEPESSISLEFLPLGGEPTVAELFDTSAFGDAQVSRELAGTSVRIRSRGLYRANAAEVVASLASRIPWSPETLLYVPRGYPSDPHYRWRAGVFDSSDVHRGRLDELIRAFTNEFQDTSEFDIVDMPELIDEQHDVAALGARVNTTVLIDGKFSTIHWSDDRTVVIDGDLQVTGDAVLERLCLMVSGEVRLYDNAQLLGVSLVVGGRVLMHGEATFSGDLLSLTAISIGGLAEVRGHSTLVTVPGNRPGPRAGPPGDGRPPVDTAAIRVDTFAISLDETARIDGVVVAVGQQGHVRVSPGVEMAGVVYAEGRVCHQGKLAGIIRAKELVDCANPEQRERRITGEQEPLLELLEYRLPFFMGVPVVTEWREETVRHESQ
jgi:hypothetical protein